MLQYNPSISGSLSVTGSLIVTNGMIGTVSGVDVQIFSSSINQVITGIQAATGSQEGRLGSIESFTSSTSARLGSIETISASNIARINSLETTSASVDTLNNTQNSRLTSLEIKTGSLASTGSNTFIGTQTITGSLYISSDLIVQGSSSLQNITASAVSIGTNIINLNTANPAIRYAGLSIGDSGSIGSSGSFLYDSVQDEMIFVHRGANTTVTSSVVLMGPQTFDSIGSETYLTANRIPKGAGNEHLADSNISDDGTTINLISRALSGSSATFNGTLGIGATNSYTTLDVRSGVARAIGATTTDFVSSTTGTVIWMGLSASTGNTFGRIQVAGNGDTLAQNLSLQAGGGLVGIGTTNPNQKLHVVGTSDSTKARFELIGTAGINEVLQIANTANYNPNRGVKMGLYVNSGSNQSQLGAEIGSAVSDTTSAYLFMSTTNSGTTTEKMRIDAIGNVGIGITNPSQKLEVNGSTKVNGTVIMNSPFAFRNKIHNGDMRIDQRYNGSSVANTNGTRIVDRFIIYNTVGSSWTTQRSTTAPPGFSHSLLATSTTGGGMSTGNYGGIRHQIEGLNTYDLAWGTASAKNITVSFWVRSSVTGTYGFTIRNGNTNNYGYVSAYTISSANTWTYITLNIPGPTAGTWATDSLPSLNCIWDLGSGTSYSQAAGSWISASEILGLTGGVKFFSNSSATYYLTGVQLEVGDVATPFETKPYSTELSLCQRYFRMIANGNDQVVLGGWSFNSTTQIETDYMSPVQMRDAPVLEQTATMYRINSAGLNDNITSTVGTIISGTNGGRLSFGLTGGVAGQGALMRIYNNGGYIGLSAEI